METIETLISDNRGNHLVVALYFYEDVDKIESFNIPIEFFDLDIADININKLDLEKPIAISAFLKMNQWLLEQFLLFPNAVFTFICSTQALETRHKGIQPEYYRWRLFDALTQRCRPRLSESGINVSDIIVGPEGYQTYARIFYRDKHAPVIHLVIDHIESKYH